MKRKIILTVAASFLIIVGLSVLFLSGRYFRKDQTPGQRQYVHDTTAARKYFDTAKKLKGEHPDSAIKVWFKTIKLLQPLKKDKRLNSLLASTYIQVAGTYCNSGDFTNAEKYNSLAMALARNTDDIENTGYALSIKGLLYFNQGDYSNAMKYYNQALVMAGKVHSLKLSGRVYSNIAVLNCLQGDCPLAIENFSKVLLIAKKIKDYDLLAGSYINIGLTYFNISDNKNAELNYRKAIDVYRKIKVHDDGITICYQNLGGIYFSVGEYSKAIEAYSESLNSATQIGDKVNTARAYHNLAEISVKLGDYKTAINQYIKSIKIKEGLRDIRGIAAGYTGLGTLHLQQRNYTRALEYYQKSFKINGQLNYVSGKASDYSNIANVYDLQNRTGEAIQNYMKALKLHKQIDEKQAVSDTYINLGSMYQKQKEYGSAESYYLNAIKQKEAISDNEGLAIGYCKLADLYLIYGETPAGNERTLKSIYYGLKSYRIAEDLHVLSDINEASLVLKKAYKKLNNLALALKYEEKCSEINDSLFSKAKAEAIIFAEARWNAEKKQRVIDNLENQKKLHKEIIHRRELESRQQKTIIYSIITLFLMTVVLAVTLSMYNKKKREMLYQKQLASITSLKMQNVRSRMSPHFFFNVLSSIYGYTNEPDLLKEKFNDLILLLRKTLENIEQTAIPLEEELSIVKTFISLQKDKIPPPFHINFSIGNEVNLQQLIPAMLIQIPVENAIKHGLLPLEGSKELEIKVSENADGQVIIIIEDNGIGLSASTGRNTGTGTGFKVLMQILQLLNSKNSKKIEFSVDAKSTGDGMNSGTIVKIEIPRNFSFNI